MLFFDDATSFDSDVHRVHAVSFDVVVLDAAATVSAACIIAVGYLVSADFCFCCHSILLLREDLFRNLELTESKPSLGEDCWELLKMTKCRFCYIESADLIHGRDYCMQELKIYSRVIS
ncbi:hypothetical protein Tco_1364452 [Tanacetum coccineum]